MAAFPKVSWKLSRSPAESPRRVDKPVRFVSQKRSRRGMSNPQALATALAARSLRHVCRLGLPARNFGKPAKIQRDTGFRPPLKSP